MKYTIGLKELPFELSSKQIIYVENNYDKEINAFIVGNYDRICDHFATRGYEFCYLPLMHQSFDQEVVTYYNPQAGSIDQQCIDSSLLLEFMARPENREKIAPSLIYYREDVLHQYDEKINLRGITIEPSHLHDDQFAQLLGAIITDQKEGERNTPLYSLKRCTELFEGTSDEELGTGEVVKPAADDAFEFEAKQHIAEIKERVDRLKQIGIHHYVLEHLLCAPVEVSRMMITRDYRIFLPDYQHMEIEMTPLVKAVYLLFLRHPEGIPFKHLPDYYHELLQIYTDIRGGWLTDDMKKSVADATSPFHNSINEKCARIREAFVSKFDEHIAEPYLIRGKRGEPKAISLTREMIEWQ